MLETRDDYEPLEIEGIIDDAYGLAAHLEEYSQEVTDMIESFEDMPYSVNSDGNYTTEQLVHAVEALNSLENIYWAAEGENRENISHIETMLTENVFKPARNHGTIL